MVLFDKALAPVKGVFHQCRRWEYPFKERVYYANVRTPITPGAAVTTNLRNIDRNPWDLAALNTLLCYRTDLSTILYSQPRDLVISSEVLRVSVYTLGCVDM